MPLHVMRRAPRPCTQRGDGGSLIKHPPSAASLAPLVTSQFTHFSSGQLSRPHYQSAYLPSAAVSQSPFSGHQFTPLQHESVNPPFSDSQFTDACCGVLQAAVDRRPIPADKHAHDAVAFEWSSTMAVQHWLTRPGLEDNNPPRHRPTIPAPLQHHVTLAT